MDDKQPAALLQLVNAIIAYRRSKDRLDRMGDRTPLRPELWQEVCSALDALTIVGAQFEIEEIE